MDRPGLRSAAQRKERRYICPDPFEAPVVSVGKPFATRLDLSPGLRCVEFPGGRGSSAASRAPGQT